MNRIMVIGVSAGAGKSTFARNLSRILNIEVYHLDTMYWEPGWIEATKEAFVSRQKQVVQKPQWIFEGNYKQTFEVREKYADTIIYLELPLYLCLYRVIKRWVVNIGKDRPDRARGCHEKLDMDFIKFICSTYYERKKSMVDHLGKLESSKKVVKLRSIKEINTFLQKLESNSD